jgi:DNA-directed RNA polymerase subunit beta'
MAYIRHQEAHEHFRDRVLEGIKLHFPVVGRHQTLHLDSLEVGGNLHPDDLRSQYEAKIKGGTWAVPVHAKLTLRDNHTGKVVDSKKIKVAEIPHITRRYSYIVNGQEYQVDNQWQLKPGIYTQRRQNGELESRFNVVGRSAFDLVFHPDTKQFVMDYNDSKIPLYPILKAMGVSDAQMEKTWGKEIYEANKNARRVAGALTQFAKTTMRPGAEPPKDSALHVQQVLSESKLNPDSTELTVGKRFDKVDGEALHLATKRLLEVQRGRPEDDRDSLVFKELRSVGDYAYDYLKQARKEVRAKIERKVDKSTDVRDVIKSDTLNKHLREVFTKNTAARVATQINPVEMVSAAMQTTILGPGGISSERSVTDEAKLINPSHFGFIDPIKTPEGSRTGITLRLSSGVSKVGTEPRIPLYNLKTKQVEQVPPKVVLQSNVVLADQVQWKDGHPVPLQETVKMLGPGNEPTAGKMKDAHYVMRRPSHFLSFTTNLIPFLGNTNGARAGYGSNHIEQAISLVHREAPLVQSGTDVPGEIDTFEKLLGSNASHRTPVAGTVERVGHDHVLIRDEKGGKHEVQLYHNFPLNDMKSVLHSEPLVKPGDKVRAGQVVADTNYSKGGVLALGTNLRVGFLPYKGYNFEDGLVISESAARKLASQHMYKNEVPVKEGMIFDPKKFQVQHPAAFKREQYQNIGDDGVVRVGAKVKPGDPLVIAMRPYQLKDRTGLTAIRKSLSGVHTDASLKWESDHEGEVVGVHKTGDKVVVHVRTVEPMQPGDKMSNRFGGKGIVTAILPDAEMPHSKDGKPIDVAFNPSGVPGRMNVGQVLEVAAGKIAQKTGKVYVARNFESGDKDTLQRMQKELKQHGLSDTEELFDPITKKSLGHVLVGPQHMFKLVHQIDKKLAVRPGMTLPGVTSEAAYSPSTLQPAGGGHAGGQAVGALGVYAMLAHGARANLREMQSFKSEGPDPKGNPAKAWPSQHSQVWAAIQTGAPLPTPRPTFAFKKFTDMLKGAGINVEKKGHHFILGPLTDKHVLELSNGELKDPTRAVAAKMAHGGEPTPLPGGIFDERITGGHGGTKWSHITLAEPLPNPIFEGPIKHLTGLTKGEYEEVLYGKKAIDKDGKVVALGHGVTGGAAIKGLLDKIDVKTALKQAEEQLKKAPDSKVDKVLKKVKYLRALDQLGVKTPSEAYILHHLPVMPPVSRPLAILPSGDIKYDDINGLYRQFGQVNAQLKDPTLQAALSDKRKENLRKDFYDGVRAIMGIHIPYDQAENKGLLHLISGATPKTGYFQDVLIGRRQDLSMRSTIVPEPSLGLDEVGLPKHAALQLFAPFVVRHLVQNGGASHALEAQKKLADVINGKDDALVWKALDTAMNERPVLLKRDPALHKYSIQAFKARTVHGSAIKIHPLVTGGFNADFDGDAMSAYVPITNEAVAEARKMFPSNNLFSEATGKLAYVPSNENVVGLYKLSTVGKVTPHKFDTPQAAVEAMRAGKIRYNDVVHIAGKPSTAGRAVLAGALPEAMRPGMLYDLDSRLNSKGVNKMLTTLARNHKADYGDVVNKIKDIGNDAVFGVLRHEVGSIPVGAHTLALSDFVADKESRSAALAVASKKIAEIAKSKMSPAEKEAKAIEAWEDATKQMRVLHEIKMRRNPNNLFLMYEAGVKPKIEQYKQLALAPMLMKDSQGRIIPNPVTTTYGEGLDIAGYWTHLHGTRRGTVRKVQEVQDPGYLTKLMQNTASHIHVDQHDCGTHDGISMHIGDPEVHDRYLQQDFKAGDVHIPAGTLLTPDVVGKMRAADKNAQIVVRSPLRCESDHGVCAKCAGLNADGHHHNIGDAVGVQAVHALGERAVQLTLKEFHTGGVTGATGMSSSLDRMMQLTYLPQKIPDAATLAMTSGKIEKIERDPTGTKIWINGVQHHVGRDRFGHSLATHTPGAQSTTYNDKPWHPPAVGTYVEAGHPLSDPTRSVINPHDLYAATKSVEKLQNHLTNEIFKLYKDEGVKRKHVETVVRAMTSVTRVKDPGDSTLLRGEVYPLQHVNRLNQQMQGKKIVHEPVIKGVDMLPHDLHTDWMAKLQHERLTNTLAEAAATLGMSNIHGAHPIPALAYGAEFGLTREHADKPGLGHLKDVPPHHY